MLIKRSWHIVVLENDEAIYKLVLESLIEPLTEVFKKQQLESKDDNVDSQEEELEILDVV